MQLVVSFDFLNESSPFTGQCVNYRQKHVSLHLTVTTKAYVKTLAAVKDLFHTPHTGVNKAQCTFYRQLISLKLTRT